MIKQCWSMDDENFRYEELCDIPDVETGMMVFKGEAVEVSSRDLICAESILDGIGGVAYDLVGEIADDFPQVSKEAKEELEDILSSWIIRHCQPNFYRVVNVQEHIVTQEDLE